MWRLELFGCVECGKGNDGLMGLRECDGNGCGKWEGVVLGEMYREGCSVWEVQGVGEEEEEEKRRRKRSRRVGGSEEEWKEEKKDRNKKKGRGRRRREEV